MAKKLVDYKDLYEALHFHELEARERISGRLQVSLGLVVALAGALAFLFGNFDQKESGFAFVLFVILLLGSAACLLWATFHLVRVFWGNTYKEIPSAAEVRKHESELHDYCHSEPPPETAAEGTQVTAAQAFENQFKGFLIEKFVNTATHNAKVNDSRSERLHFANRAILLTAGAASFAFIAFTLGSLRSHTPTEVRITGPTDANVLAVPGYGLTCDQLRALICENQPSPRNEAGSLSDERQEEEATPTTAKTTGENTPDGTGRATGQVRPAGGSASTCKEEVAK